MSVESAKTLRAHAIKHITQLFQVAAICFFLQAPSAAYARGGISAEELARRQAFLRAQRDEIVRKRREQHSMELKLHKQKQDSGHTDAHSADMQSAPSGVRVHHGMMNSSSQLSVGKGHVSGATYDGYGDPTQLDYRSDMSSAPHRPGAATQDREMMVRLALAQRLRQNMMQSLTQDRVREDPYR